MKCYSVILLIFISSISLFGQVSPSPNSVSTNGEASSGCSQSGEVLSNQGMGTLLFGGTGNKSVDALIQTDVVELQQVLGVTAKMFLFEESGAPNAFAVGSPLPQVLQVYRISSESSADGMVFFGLNLMQSEYKSEFGTGYSIPSIIAHEYAHVLQDKLGFPYGGKWRELHADYVAGWYTAHRSRFVPQNIFESMLAFYKRGDYAFNAPLHHGTPLERQQAFTAGVNLNLRTNVKSGRFSYAQGIQYLRRRGAGQAGGF